METVDDKLAGRNSLLRNDFDDAVASGLGRIYRAAKELVYPPSIRKYLALLLIAGSIHCATHYKDIKGWVERESSIYRLGLTDYYRKIAPAEDFESKIKKYSKLENYLTQDLP